ncbi:uncharacterized protein BX663DRAFT_546658 [Cokeromyces recurvatus]|uniref:uncharacterized protein n=1 Tax=Cokeromyces recurvatus TaxID=90255 RepID=UPI00221F4A5B|nr:uncharacterized protein BX663DRAFT_546658 [Cokeromyces recurvatus]KAI7898166.1 hypothetical protein BX663DRAFT_546658 [Cokeromyces recurvatus]
MSIQDDNWELDINLGSDSTHNIFKRKGVFNLEPDKELMLACERYQYANQNMYFEDDDTNSSIASGSVISSRFSEVDAALNNLDDFMFEEPPLTRIEEEEVQINQSNLPGVVKRIGLPARYQTAQENDDWNDDIEIPSNGMSLLSTKLQEKEYDDLQLSSLDDDDIGPSVSQRASRVSLLPDDNPSMPISSSNMLHYQHESEEDDMSGLDFPENMNTLSKRLDEIKGGVISETMITTKPTSNLPSRIPISSSLKKSSILSKFQKEDDNDNFFEGLHIKDNAFTTTSSKHSYLPKQSTHQQSRLTLSSSSNNNNNNNKGKTPASFTSRLVRPSPINQNRKTYLDQDLMKNNHSQQQYVPSSRRTTSSNVNAQSPLHHEPDIVTSKRTVYLPRQQQQRQNMGTKNSHLTGVSSFLLRSQDSSPSVKKSVNGYTLIARPKTKTTTSYCSRLDNIDNLNDLRPTNRKPHVSFKDRLKYESTASDPQRPWRQNMHASTTKRQSAIKLIKPNEQNLKKEYNDMKYDESTHCWKGNEASLISFQEKPPIQRHSRLMLMTHKQQKPSKYAAVMGNNMIFNSESQKWVSAFGSDQECNELDEIEDLKEELCQQPKQSLSSNLYRVNNTLEFELSVEIKRQMVFEQEMHENWIQNWPLNPCEPEVMNETGYNVGASKYFLYNQDFKY